ncbi:MAG: GNAT family N-acetyltransferase [Dehalococcoidia bacterium]|nr:GNAT family N-acetyltransferase [Dehalococcoidia bacterium]
MATSPSSSDLEKYKTAVILKDGSTLYLRPIRLEDEEKLLAPFYRLSPHTVYLRFHNILRQMSREEAQRFCTVDYDNNFALVATIVEDGEEKIIAVGRYNRLPRKDTAEMAFVVEDAYQGKGIGTHLLEQLAIIARKKGIRLFEGEVLADNQEMMQVLKDSGFQITQELEQGVYRVVLDLVPTLIVEEMSIEREKVATVASLMAFLKPRSIAVIGASRREGTIGNKLFRNLLHQSFNGVIYPVNPNAEVVASVKAYPSVLDIPGGVDLAVVIVPAKTVEKVVEQCGRKGVQGIVVISAGFGESGPEGMDRQNRLLEITRKYGMRLVGPNCMGIINTDPQVSMNATFSSVFPPTGRIAFCTQSGALGLAILEYARSLNIGLSTFVSMGNRADVSSNDLLQYWEEDPATDVILLYLESFGNPRKFARIGRSITATKPAIIVKSGRTPAGSRAAASHTGALATAEVASEALFRQAGIIRVDTLEELFDVASLLSHQPLPLGRRVVILTNGGGPGILTADACAARGLELPTLSDKTLSELKNFLPPGASLGNPIDMTAEATAEEYSQALELLAQDNNIDIVIVIFIPPIVTQPEAVARAIREAVPRFRQQSKTLVASFMGSRGASIELGSREEGYVPSFTFPESTATALAKACEYSDWLERPKGVIPELGSIDKKKAGQIIKTALEGGMARPLWLDATSITELLDSYGIHMVRSKSARTAEEAANIAKGIGFPVAVKLLSDTITHKTEVGGVILGLHSQRGVKQAFIQISERLVSLGREDEMQGVVVQEMISRGVEVIVGVTQDPSFGPLILFGMGGIYAELFKDVAFRIHPLTDVDAQEMIRSGKAYQLLKGWRGAEPSDIKALEELLLRISTMVEDLPQITELDLNPVKILERTNGYMVVDARVMLA